MYAQNTSSTAQNSLRIAQNLAATLKNTLFPLTKDFPSEKSSFRLYNNLYLTKKNDTKS
jgi:hypothetical protein